VRTSRICENGRGQGDEETDGDDIERTPTGRRMEACTGKGTGAGGRWMDEKDGTAPGSSKHQIDVGFDEVG
jgi:hypothetical protein